MLNAIENALFVQDLMGLGTVENDLHDEYKVEAEQILHNVESGEVNSVADMKECVIFVFSHYFADSFNADVVTDEVAQELFDLIK